VVEKGPEAFRTISEVAEDLDLPQHVLRFWETRFNQIKPLKRGGGRRYYRPDDVDLLCGIRLLLYGEGYTIKGVQRLLKEKGLGFVVEVGRAGSVETLAAADDEAPVHNGAQVAVHEPERDLSEPMRPPSRPLPADRRKLLETALSELLEVKRLLDRAGAQSSA
jgi:DNA-binding transcriptional MerR regulator